MAQIPFDLSGLNGLIERHQGDLNTSAASPELRYLGGDGQMADGIFNPYKKLGYISPSVDSFIKLSGTITSPINSIQYDADTDVLYFSDGGKNILKLDGLDDTSLSNHLSISTGTIKDMILYELNESKVLLYVVDAGVAGGMYVGFTALSSDGGADTLIKNVNALSTGITTISLVRDADAVIGGTASRKIAQSFSSSDLIGSLKVSSVELALKENAITTPSGVTVRISLQTNSTKTDSPYSNAGTWTTATGYSQFDVVTDTSVDYVCTVAHTSDSAKRPGSGLDWPDYWSPFNGAPSGTELAYVETTADELFSYVDAEDNDDFGNPLSKFVFNTSVTLTAATRYWIVIEETGSNLGSSESVLVKTTTSTGSIYTTEMLMGYYTDLATDAWVKMFNDGNQSNRGTAHFKLRVNSIEDWSYSTANGAFKPVTGQETFLYLADNSLVYWFTNNKVHTIDGSITGGPLGRVVANALSFPEYTTVRSVAETRSRMFLGIQTANKGSSSDMRNFTAKKSGVFVWDRQSQILGGTDFYPTPGAQDIKALFPSSTGDVLAITTGNSGYSEIRSIVGNQYAVVQTFEKDGYPNSYRSINQLNNTSLWLGANGLFYSYGSPAPGFGQSLVKLGDMSGEAASNLVTGPIFVGHEVAGSTPQTAVLFGWDDSTTVAAEVDSYSNSNIDNDVSIGSVPYNGQTFTGNDSYITDATFYLKNTASETGNVYAYLYATSGGVPTGSALATSDVVDISTIGATYEAVQFTFSGDQQYFLDNGTTYLISVHSADVSGTDFYVGTDNSSPTHSGTSYDFFGSSWTSNTYDIAFILNGSKGGYAYKWYPFGEDTLNSVAQTTNAGNIYTQVEYLPPMSTVRDLTIYCAPTGTADGTTIATVKLYKNQQTTPFSTKTITNTQAARGYVKFELNQHNCNAVQFEIEYASKTIEGDNEFYPSLAIMNYEPTTTHTPDQG